ncbi:hypothetical protein [Sphaerisporangium dianthi]|uniref:Uncharacterized protein n=1 Tax=Sphaerisporangium dianthi TaxID=1436120 RepID=A0ABV9CTF9_9ACTN
MAVTGCWHCMLRDITLSWQPSLTYPDAFAGYVHRRAKVAGVFRRSGKRWEGKLFLTLGDDMPSRSFNSRADAEQWCTEQVRLWFAQLDHDEP